MQVWIVQFQSERLRNEFTNNDIILSIEEISRLLTICAYYKTLICRQFYKSLRYMNYTLLTTCSNPVEAEILQDLLLKNGIQAEINEQVMRPGNIAVGGIDELYYAIVIDEANLPKAKSIIAQFRKENEKDEIEGMWCPECGSENIEKLSSQKSSHANVIKWVICLAVVVLFLFTRRYLRAYIRELDGLSHWIVLGVILVIFLFATYGLSYLFSPHTTTKYHCKDCGHKFDKIS